MKMKLYKAVNQFANYDDESGFLVAFADNVEQIKDKVAEVNVHDDYIAELFNDDEGYMKAMRKYINIEDVGRKIYKDVNIPSDWSIDEFEVDVDEYDVYVAYNADIDDVKTVLVKKDIKDAKDEIYSQLAVETAMELGFRKYVSCNAINASPLEKFYSDRKGLMFDYDSEYEEVRDDILNKYNGDKKAANQYVEQKMIDNVYKYFSDRKDLADMYFKHLKNGNEDNNISLNEKFYLYMAKKMLFEGDWTRYEIRKVELY